MVTYSLKFPRPSIRLIAGGFFLTLLLFYSLRHSYSLRNTLSYATRPLWDSEKGSPQQYLPHLYAEGLPPNDTSACLRHGWKPRSTQPKLIDAVIFSVEIELLEIRLRELWDVVDTFVILESGHTFTGNSKNYTFAENRARFTQYESKISYSSVPGRTLRSGEDEFQLEGEMRTAVSAHINSLPDSGDRPLVLMSDVDEIPARHTLALLKACESPLPLHLQLRNYVYSYEFVTDFRSWRAQVHEWVKGSTWYHHGKSSDKILSDSGWHCSFCFARISDFAFKMTSYSHSDRLYGNPHWRSFLDPARIQERICQGKDLFDMLPEAYSWSELFEHWNGATQTKSAVHIPKPVIEDPKKFGFLLPGGCKRDP
ncbi:glycosyl transferase [Violaceomyces palustris]|uniref:Glycosyl transferase n=1 Tax=Violaceomyces palustris TaxID=1673888 RepID=A0ACD0NV44_9BASI|nr:glycosyl transferase [Violaceomyces palustris]